MNNGGPAFPSFQLDSHHSGRQVPVHGMSLRDWFAGMALQGMLARVGGLHGVEGVDAARAFAYADAMIAAREQK